MDTMTSTVGDGSPSKPFDLAELSAVMMRRDKVPYGFFLSQALWNAISARFVQEGNDPLAPIPTTFHGVRTVVDPRLEPETFDVAFTEDAWRKRLAELSVTRA